MDCATELSRILSLSFNGNKARIDCLAQALIGLQKSMTTNLTKVAMHMPSATKVDSKYRRLQRFFNETKFNQQEYRIFVINQLPLNEKYILIVDRTNWKFGQKDINFLVLSIAWRGVAIPLAWTELNKAGNSNTTERIEMIGDTINELGIERIHAILGDREFVGKEWFEQLNESNIKFVFRIKKSSLLQDSEEDKNLRAENSFKNLPAGKSRISKLKLCGLDVSVVGHKDKEKNIYILATNGNPQEAFDLYSMRWQIETMFFCLKTNGFNLEATHMFETEKLENLFGVLSILICLNCKIGCWGNAIKPIKIKNHERPAYGLFNYGLRIMSAVLSNIKDYAADFKKILKLLIKPPHLINSHAENVTLACL